MIPLKYNTASQEVPLGYFVDDTDGKTAETGLTIANTDIKLWKSGATTLANKNSGGATHISGGVYYAVLDATDTGTYGPMKIFVHVSGALPVILECIVMEADAYDALYAAAGTGHIEADAVQISGDATAANNAESFFDGTGYAGTNNVIPTVTTLTGHTAQTGDNYARIGAPAGASVSADVAAVKAETALIVADTNELQSDDVPGLIAALNDPTAATIADAVWDEAATGHTDAGKAGAQLWTDIDAILADTNELQSDDVPGLIGALNDPTAGAIADQVWEEAIADHSGTGGSTAEALAGASAPTAAAVADAVWDEAKAGHVGAGSFGEEVQAHALTTDVDAVPTAAENRAEMDSNSTQLAAIVADTNELQSDDVPGLISALNDPTAAAIADQVWEETLADHSGTAGSTAEALNAAGGAGDPWVTALPGAYGAGSAGNIVGNLNDLSAAQVNAEVDTALADYDGPTKAELDSGLAALNDPTAAAIADAVLDEALSGHVAAGSLGKAVADIETDATAILADTNELQSDDVPGLIAALPTAAENRTEMDSNSTQLAAIVADTNELQADWANGGRLDLIIDAVLADTNELQGDWTNGGRLDLIIDAILADTNELQTDDVPGLIAALNDLSAAEVNTEVDTAFTTQMADSVPADGAIPTREQAIYMINQFLLERAVSGTTVTVKKVDGSTALMTLTLNDGTTPTSITRAT